MEVSTPNESLKERLPEKGSDGSNDREKSKETVEELSIALEDSARPVRECPVV